MDVKNLQTVKKAIVKNKLNQSQKHPINDAFAISLKTKQLIFKSNSFN